MQTDRQPLYVQIQDFFKQRIESGLLMPDAKIPPEKELMEQFGVSRITVANALTQLAEEGWIYRIPGKGSFVMKEGEDKQRGNPGNDPSSGYDEFGTYTHISQSEMNMGREAATILLGLLESSQSPGNRTYSNIVLQPELVVRHSTDRRRREESQSASGL